MSSAADFQSFMTSLYCACAATTLIFVEYLALLPQEIDLFWKRRLTGASVLFLCNRYLSLLAQVFIYLNLTSDKSCAIILNAYWAIKLPPYFSCAVFSALRTCALGLPHLKWPLGMLVLLLSSVPVVLNYTLYRWSRPAVQPTFGCFSEDLIPMQLARDFTIISRVCIIVADIIVLGVTWHGTYRATQLMHTVPGKQGRRTYSGTLLRDGTLYFLVLAILNSLHLVFSMLSIAVIALQPTSYITAFTDPITSILVSRFLIDLQEVQKYKADPQLSSLSVGPAFHLATPSRVIGSLGESLPAPGAWDTSLLEDERVAAEDASASEDFDSYGSEEVGQDEEAGV